MLTKLFNIIGKKQFQNKTVYEYHLNGKKHKKAAAKMMNQGVMEVQNSQLEKMKKDAKNKLIERRKPIALIESYIRGYSETLNAVREDTKANVERKQVLNEKEFVSI